MSCNFNLEPGSVLIVGPKGKFLIQKETSESGVEKVCISLENVVTFSPSDIKEMGSPATDFIGLVYDMIFDDTGNMVAGSTKTVSRSDE